MTQGTHAHGPEEGLSLAPPALAGLRPIERIAALVGHAKLVAIPATWETPQPAIIVGPTGVGKSAALCALHARMSDAVDRWTRSLPEAGRMPPHPGPVPSWTTGQALEHAARRAPLGVDPLERCRDARFLIIEDPDWAKDDATFIELVHHRYDQGLVTIVTSGQREKTLVERFGMAVLRRVLESGPGGEIVSAWGAA